MITRKYCILRNCFYRHRHRHIFYSYTPKHTWRNFLIYRIDLDVHHNYTEKTIRSRCVFHQDLIDRPYNRDNVGLIAASRSQIFFINYSMKERLRQAKEEIELYDYAVHRWNLHLNPNIFVI